MRRIKCHKCGSVGYSASLDTTCECGGRCNEIIILNEISNNTNGEGKDYLTTKSKTASVIANILKSLL
jgi:hypothetical protein